MNTETQNLTKEEQQILEYFAKEISVGEILAEIEIKRKYNIEKPQQIIKKLIQKGLLERKEGCYNLAKHLREKAFQQQTHKPKPTPPKQEIKPKKTKPKKKSILDYF